MASRYPSKNNPFGGDDDEFEQPGNFGQSRQPAGYGGGGYNSSGYNPSPSYNKLTSAHEHVQAQLQASRERTLESQRNALQSLYTSEKLGVATAEELLEQGEKLRRTDQKLDDIGNMQKQTQMQINSLSSVFGGVKNWFARKPSAPANGTAATAATKTEVPKPASSAQLEDALKKIQSPPSDRPSFGSATAQAHSNPGKNAYQQQFDENLDEMSGGLHRLKHLAIGLEGELKTQNQLLDGMHRKTESVNETMKRQDRQLNVLLGKK